MRLAAASLVLAIACWSTIAAGADVPRPLAVTGAWARATPPGSPVGAIYLTIDNTGGRADRLLSVTSPRAGSAEVHAIEHDGDLVRMRRVDPLHIAAGERLALAPGGIHVMLMGLTAPLVAGEKVPLVLVFERSGELRLQVVVRPADGVEGPVDPHAH
jgi:copper(I)-binding protein